MRVGNPKEGLAAPTNETKVTYLTENQRPPRAAAACSSEWGNLRSRTLAASFAVGLLIAARREPVAQSWEPPSG